MMLDVPWSRQVCGTPPFLLLVNPTPHSIDRRPNSPLSPQQTIFSVGIPFISPSIFPREATESSSIDGFRNRQERERMDLHLHGDGNENVIAKDYH